MKTLYIIHGWTYSVEPWEKTLEILKADGFPTKMLHVPGLTTDSRKIFTIEDYVDWANENIPDDAIALGHSNGGRILLNLASKRPEKLRHLILLNSAGVYEPSKKRDLLKTVSKLGAPLKKIPFAEKAFHKLIGATDYDRAPKNMKETLKNMLESDKNLDLSSVTTKTTILWGKSDTVTPLHQGKLIHEKLKNSTFKSFDWPHAPYITDPKTLAAALESVLKEVA